MSKAVRLKLSSLEGDSAQNSDISVTQSMKSESSKPREKPPMSAGAHRK